MNQRPTLQVRMSRKELIAGLIYLPFYLFLLSVILEVAAVFLGFNLLDAGDILLINLAYGGINFLFVVVAFRRFLVESLRVALEHPLAVIGFALSGVFLFFGGTAVVRVLEMLFDPTLVNVNDASVMKMADANTRAMIVFTVLLAPIVEECLFRGVIFSNLHRKSRLLAHVVNILVFSALHVMNYIGHFQPVTLLLCMVQYFPASFVLAWVYERTDTIWTSILLHMCANGVSMAAMVWMGQMI